jgi:hypothetical protein
MSSLTWDDVREWAGEHVAVTLNGSTVTTNCQMERALSRSDLLIEQGPRGLGTLARTPNPLKEVGTVD